jgi:NAD(P)-dependent dehydrogenase (short-subunit alcohol dehydrogenase family)
MNLKLGTQKVLVTGGAQNAAQAISRALAQGDVDLVIWIRDLNLNSDPVDELTNSNGKEPAIPSDRTPHASLWRETMGY